MTLKTINEWTEADGLSAEEIQRVKDDWKAAKPHMVNCKYRECRRLQAIDPNVVVRKLHGTPCCPCTCRHDARLERKKKLRPVVRRG